MRSLATVAVLLILTAGGALAQSPSGNVGQPERAVPQAGNTTRSPIDNPSVYGAYRNADTGLMDLDVTGSIARPLPSNGTAIIVDSAKGGNAELTNRIVPNLGTTSGGPEF